MAMLRTAALAAAATQAAAAQINIVESSAVGETWTNKGSVPFGAPGSASSYIVVDRSSVLQTILGFGAALTDTSAINYLMMNSTTQAEFLDACWGPKGLGYTAHRVPINSPDFAAISFNYDNVTDDFDLKYFDGNLTYDREHVIPLIQAATAHSPDPLFLFGSPWSPPGWMKTNNNMISSNDPCLKADTPQGSYAASWASYFVKWIQGMKDAGVDINAVTVQNEPGYRPFNYEGCLYSAEEHRDFVKNHLGPTLKGAFPNVALWGYDYNKQGAAQYVQTNFADPETNAYLDGTAVHWYDIGNTLGIDDLNAIHALNTSKPIIATEACWIPGLVETWQVAELYALDIAADINAWASGWVEWNIVLHYNNDGKPTGRGIRPGGPNHVGSAFGSALLLLQNDDGTEALIYQPTYWAIGHFSRYARPGSTRIGTDGSAGIAVASADYEAVRAHIYSGSKNGAVPLVASAFLSADASTVSVVVLNAGEVAVDFEVRDAALGAAKVTIPAHAIQTLTYSTKA